ncbi:MAG: hypothetical protein IJ730_04940 [Alphaproteobacteria bacterium]|nr:hypothetical protein [Alphaproteobacteria bacterium]
MFSIPIESLDDWVREYQRDLMLNCCIRQPLLSELDQFVKTDELGRFLRDKAIARLSGTLPENDDNLQNTLMIFSNIISYK